MRVGVLALQGAFIEHEKMLESLGAETFEIRQRRDIDQSMDAIVLPGGESTVMGKLLNELDLMNPVRDFIKGGMPVFGTCAGLILLAEKIYDDSAVHIGTMNITARRNAYGRQLGSFNAKEEFKGIGEIPMTFIRAPYIEEIGEKAEVLAVCEGKIVAARQDKQLVTAFHPELTDDISVHKYFLEEICK
jgi:5'-phosphate synthase pdxT subunit